MSRKFISTTLLYVTVTFIILVVFAGSAGAYFLSGQLTKPFYEIKTAQMASLPSSGDAPEFPDLSRFNAGAVKMMLPAATGGRISIQKMSAPSLPVLSGKSLLDLHVRMQGNKDPVYIELSSGTFDLRMIADDNVGVGHNFVERTAAGWLLKVPLVIGPQATLVVSGADNSLRLAAERGAFIGNFGRLYVVDSAVSGWRVQRNEPAQYDTESDFRPYLVSWNGSATYLVNSKFSHLGYDGVKSYGVTLSTSTDRSEENGDVARPGGWVIGNEFEDLYFGLYTYEASNVIIKDNVFRDNIVYGIDPHDRSDRIIIAGNEVSGTKKRHGINLSRNVNESWIVNNHLYDNAGSGIVLDRSSINNVVANNISERNGGDGISFLESSENVSWKNRTIGNKGSGIRIRNSSNIRMRGEHIAENVEYGIEAYAGSVDDRRNDVDRYQQHTEFDIADSTMDSNGEGHFQVSGIDGAKLSNLQIFQSSSVFEGDFNKYETALYQAVTTPGVIAEVKKANPVKLWLSSGFGGKQNATIQH